MGYNCKVSVHCVNDDCTCSILFGCAENSKIISGENSKIDFGESSQIKQQLITAKNIHTLKQHLVSIKNGGTEKLNFQTKGIDTCVNLCKDARIKGICNFGSSCQVRTLPSNMFGMGYNSNVVKWPLGEVSVSLP